MRMMNRNIKLEPSTTARLAMHPDNLHLILTLLLLPRLPLLFFFFLLLITLIILQLPPQPRHNILNPSLALLQRKIPTPIPPPRLLIRLNRRPLPQLRQLGFTKRLVRRLRRGNRTRVRMCGVRRGQVGARFPAARDPVFDAGVEFCAEELLEGVGLRAAWVVRAWVGDERGEEVAVVGEVVGDADEVV